MTDKTIYIESLKWRLDEIKNKIFEKQKTIQNLFKDVEIMQEQAKHIIVLLKTEEENYSDPELESITDVNIADVVFELLNSDGSKTPMHYSDITNEIMAKGILIPGKNPSSNLLTHINRDNRFIRTAPGTYALEKWGLKGIPTRKRKISKNKK